MSLLRSYEFSGDSGAINITLLTELKTGLMIDRHLMTIPNA